MTIDFWILVAVLCAVGAWGWYLFRHQHRKMQILKQSLLEINQQTHQQEALHTENKTRWEQTEEKLRSFLQLMDTLMNTISNPIYFKDVDGVYQGCNKVFSKQILGLTRDRIIGKRPQELPEQIPADRYPHLREFTADYVLQPGYDFGREFDAGIEIVIAERVIALLHDQQT